MHVGARRLGVFALIEDVIKPYLPAGPDERLRAAVAADARESFVRLQQRVDALEAQLQAQGRSLDDPGAKRTVAVAQEIATGVAGAYGEPKIDAVLNAGARQFDPRLGPQEVRKYWLDRVIQLTDLEVQVLMQLKEHAPLYYFVSSGEMFGARAAAARTWAMRIASRGAAYCSRCWSETTSSRPVVRSSMSTNNPRALRY